MKYFFAFLWLTGITALVSAQNLSAGAVVGPNNKFTGQLKATIQLQNHIHNQPQQQPRSVNLQPKTSQFRTLTNMPQIKTMNFKKK